jgi:Ca2+-binding EF-hand superfamily protein
MEDEKIMEQAKLEFHKYVGDDQEKMSYADFECFLKNFFKDQPETLKNLDVKEVFNEFSKEEKGKIDEREFRIAFKELKISRMDTNDKLIFEGLQ